MDAVIKAASTAVPDVSLIMAAYNAEACLGAAMESILAQPGIVLELIIVDDASTDQTLHQAATCQHPAVTVLALPQNSGAAVARNLAISRARADWVCIFDADDIMKPGTLAPYFHTVTRQPGVFWGYCGLELMSAAGAPLGAFMATPFDPIKLLQVNYIPHPMSLFRRDVFEQVGGYAAELRRSEDYDLWLRLAELGDPFFFEPCGVLYRQGAEPFHRQDMNDRVRIRLRERLAMPAAPLQAARRCLLAHGQALLDAQAARQWSEVLNHARALTQMDVDSLGLDQLAIEALIALGRLQDAFIIAVERLQSPSLARQAVRDQWIWLTQTAMDLAMRLDHQAALKGLRDYVALNPGLNREPALTRPGT